MLLFSYIVINIEHTIVAVGLLLGVDGVDLSKRRVVAWWLDHICVILASICSIDLMVVYFLVSLRSWRQKRLNQFWITIADVLATWGVHLELAERVAMQVVIWAFEAHVSGNWHSFGAG